jgi:SAM-dependent methyltransferase
MSRVVERPVYVRQRRYFRRAYETGEHPWPADEPSAFVRRLVVRHASGDRALDLGCGEGRHSILLARMGWRVWAVDYEPMALARARRKVAAAGCRARVRFREADALALPFRPGSFDLVVDSGCFHHIVQADWPRYRSEVRRVLRPGGTFVLTVFTTGFRHYPGEVRRRPWLVHRGHYDHFFTRRALVDAFSGDFRVLEILKERSGLSEFWHAAFRRLDELDAGRRR